MCSLSLNNLLLLDEVGMAEWARIVKYFRRSFGWVVFSYKVDFSPGRINFVDPDGSQSDIDVDVLAEVLRATPPLEPAPKSLNFVGL